MTDTLTALDATFLELEQLDEGALMSIGGVMVFDPLPGGGSPDASRTSATSLAARLGALPRYSQRLSSTRTRRLRVAALGPRRALRHPRTTSAEPRFPRPGTDAQLCDWTAEFFSHPLDRTRPLWEIVLVEGLEDGRWALAHKTHHCLVDGVGSVDVVSCCST